MTPRKRFGRRVVAGARVALLAAGLVTAGDSVTAPAVPLVGIVVPPAPGEPAPGEPVPDRPARDRPVPDQPVPERRPDRAGIERALDRRLESYLDGRPGRPAVAVRDLTTGLAYSYGGGLRPATASIVKVDIVVALLLKAQRRGRALTPGEQALAERAIKVSDNDAAGALWNQIGGAPGLAAANRKLGLRATRPGPGGAWGATVTSAADQIRLLKALTSADGPLSGRNRRFVLDLMEHVAAEQAWGVRTAGGRDARVAVKNGWLPREVHGGRWTINSIGRVRGGDHDYLIAVLSERNPTMDDGVRTVEHVCEVLAEELGRERL